MLTPLAGHAGTEQERHQTSRCQQTNTQQADPGGQVNDDGHEGSGHPGHLKTRLETSEGATPVGFGRISLHDGVERQTPDRRRHTNGSRQHRSASFRPVNGHQQPEKSNPAQTAGKHGLFLQSLAQPGRQRVAGERADGRSCDHYTEPPDRRALFSQPERHMKRQEANGGAHDRHGRRRQCNADGAQHRFFFRLDAVFGHSLPGQLEAVDRRKQERGRCQGQHRFAVVEDRPQSQSRRGHGQPAEPRQQAEFGVGLHQLVFAAHYPRNERTFGDGVGLGQHEYQEGLREQPVRLEVADHRRAKKCSQERTNGHHPTAATLQPVEQRPHQRRDHREGSHGEHQVQRNLAARLPRTDIEEQRSGQGNSNSRVPCCGRGVGAGQASEGRNQEASLALGQGRLGAKGLPTARRVLPHVAIVEVG